jgi:hypothetical protein
MTRKPRAIAFLLGLLLGAGGTYLVLRAVTARWQMRATSAEAAASVLRAQSAAHEARADAFADSVARIRTASVPLPSIGPRIERIVRTVPDAAAVDSLVTVARELEGALRDTTQLLRLRDQEVGELRAALGLTAAAADTVTAALGDRPSAIVTWEWRPKLQALAFARFETTDGVCAGAGPSLGLWRLRVHGYVSLCGQAAVDRSALEPRAGVQVELRLF